MDKSLSTRYNVLQPIYFIRWITTYPLDKVIRSLNNLKSPQVLLWSLVQTFAISERASERGGKWRLKLRREGLRACENPLFPRFVPREFGLSANRVSLREYNFGRKITVLLVIVLSNVRTNKQTNEPMNESTNTSKQTKKYRHFSFTRKTG